MGGRLSRALGRGGRAPAVHMVLLGTLLAVVSAFRAETTGPLEGNEEIVVPASRLAEAEERFLDEHRRGPDAAEREALRERLVDDELLFRHALRLGLHDAEVPRRRLAQLAAFVESSEEAPSADDTARLAQEAVELGLHHGDLVTRAILIDAARRLVRGAARQVEPDEATLDAVLRQHAERFRTADRARISHALVGGERAPTSPGSGEELPPLSALDLDRRFGDGFSAEVAALPLGVWSGPIKSRYGKRLVFVHERLPGRLPELAEVRPRVVAQAREDAADRHLAQRLQELRAELKVTIETAIATTAASNATQSSENLRQEEIDSCGVS